MGYKVGEAGYIPVNDLPDAAPGQVRAMLALPAYAVFGTERAHGAMWCPVLSKRMVLRRLPRVCFAALCGALTAAVLLFMDARLLFLGARRPFYRAGCCCLLRQGRCLWMLYWVHYENTASVRGGRAAVYGGSISINGSSAAIQGGAADVFSMGSRRSTRSSRPRWRARATSSG
eukprot:3845283-Rhodomonas_salina.1